MSLYTSALTLTAILSAVNSMVVPANLAERSPRPVVQMSCYSTYDCAGEAPTQDLFYMDGNNNDTSGMCIPASDCNCVHVTWLNNARFEWSSSQDCSSAEGAFNNDCTPIFDFEHKNVTVKTPGANSFSFFDGCDA